MRKTEEPEGKKELIPEALNWIIRYPMMMDCRRVDLAGHWGQKSLPAPMQGSQELAWDTSWALFPALAYPTQGRKGADSAVTWFRVMNYWPSAKWVGSWFCLPASMEKIFYEWFILSHYSRAQIDNKSLKSRENIATSTLSHSPVFGGWVRSPSHLLDYEDFTDVCVCVYVYI